MKSKPASNAPKHLQPATRDWWVKVNEDFSLEDHHRRLLTLSGEAFDRCQQAREALAKHGMTFEDRFGSPRARPEIGIERDSRLAFARLLRELNLDIESPSEVRIHRGGRYG